MNTVNNTIDTATIGKYIFEIESRGNATHLPNYPFRVVYSKSTPKAKWSKTKVLKSLAFKTIEECEEWIAKTYRNIYLNMKADEKRKAEKREAQKALNASDFFEVGTIIYNSWGYEQTNVSFYQVVKMTKKRITVREVSQSREEGSTYSHGMAWNVVANEGMFVDGGEELNLTVRPEGRLSTPRYHHGCFSKWDGSPKYVSCYY
jgi:hypothetical protein